MDVTRRETLLATRAAFGLAGCIDSTIGNNGNDSNGDDDPEDAVQYDVFQLGPASSRPLWTTVEDATGFITLIESEDDPIWMVEDSGEIEGLESWLDETNFEESTIVYVETVGPNTCYSTIGVSGVAVEEGKIVAAARAVDTSEENETCGSAETYPSAFVRVTGPDLPSDVTFTVTDGWDESSEVAADGRYADPENLPGHVRPGGDPAKLEEFSCDDQDFRRLQGPGEEAALGDAHEDDDLTFAMRFHGSQALTAGGDEGSPTVGRGHEVRITMWNVSTEMQYTGNLHKYSLQVLTMDGWQDVRGTTYGDPVGYTDEALKHRPGEGFEWTFEMTEAGVIEEGHPHEERLTVCPGLPAGRYRFVYHEAGGEPLAVEFDYQT
jgi:hypothetical protein